MREPGTVAVAIPSRPRHLRLVYNSTAMSGWDAQLERVVRRVIRAMSEAHPSTLIEELLGPLRQLHMAHLPNNTDALAGRITDEINDALAHGVAERADVPGAAARWLARMEGKRHEPARCQYRELLSLLA